MADTRPVWRQVFDAVVEGAVAPRLDALVRSEPFAVAVGLANEARRNLQQQTERTTRRILHAYNLPAGSDVTRILNELGELRRQVRELSSQVGKPEARGNGADARPKRPARPASS